MTYRAEYSIGLGSDDGFVGGTTLGDRTRLPRRVTQAPSHADRPSLAAGCVFPGSWPDGKGLRMIVVIGLGVIFVLVACWSF